MTNIEKIKQLAEEMKKSALTPEEKAEFAKMSEIANEPIQQPIIEDAHIETPAPIIEEPVEEKQEEIKSLSILDGKEKKAITDINLSDVKVAIDTSKSAGQQTEEVIDFAATVAAAQDGETVKRIGEAKKEEIVDKATIKAKEARAKSVEADTVVQQAKMEKFQLLFETFGVTKHIPDWLLSVLMCIFAPFYVLFVIIIGIPTGFVRFLTDAVDGILVRYDDTAAGRKPRLKVTVLVVLSLIIVAAICLTILGCLHVI